MIAIRSPSISLSLSGSTQIFLIMQLRCIINLNLFQPQTFTTMTDKNKEKLQWIINLLASILTALAAALGTSACVGMN